MQHTVYNSVAPFDFGDLKIHEVTPPGLSSASIAEIVVPSGATHPRARSTRSDKLYMCLAGEVIFQLDGGEVRLTPKDTLAILREHWFSYDNLRGDEARLLLVHVPPFDLASEEFAER